MESRALGQYHRLAKKYDGEFDRAAMERAFEEVQELVAPGTYIGLGGRIAVKGVVCMVNACRLTDVRVAYIPAGGRDEQSMEVITFLEYYRRFAPDLL